MTTVKLVAGNGLIRQAKRAFTEYNLALTAKQVAKHRTIGEGILTPINASFATWDFSTGHPYMGAFMAAFTAYTSGLTVKAIRDFVKASKAKKEALNKIREILSNKDFKEIVDRWCSKKGEIEMTPNQMLEKIGKVDLAK